MKKMHKWLFAITTYIAVTISLVAQDNEDVQILKEIYDATLKNSSGYLWLDHLSNDIGGRLSGSLNAKRAVTYTKEELEKLGLDKVWLQPVMVPKWVRGNPEFAYIEPEPGKTLTVNICALGGSVSTPVQGVKANVIEVTSIDELKVLPDEQVTGKIVFYNSPLNPVYINTFQAYNEGVDQQYSGAVEAGKKGAVGVLVRSLNFRQDDDPHTGVMTYGNLPNSQRIPSAAISTNHADLLSNMLSLDPKITFYFKQNCSNLKDVQSYNVIGELKGSQFPNEIILFGGHLDSWDLGDGSHDNGAGCVQVMDVIKTFKELGIKPKRTLRVVLFMNKENGLRGAQKYTEVAKKKGEEHIFALESDAGGFSPRGFNLDCGSSNFEKIQSWQQLFNPYLIHLFEKGKSGANVELLKTNSNIIAGLRTDSQRYFDHHHAASDTFDAVNKRELELGAAAMTSLVYLVDKYGISKL